MYVFTYNDFLKYMENEKYERFMLEKVKPYIEEFEKNKTELDKKHDKIFKNILSNKKEAVRFINRKFKIKLNEEEIELYNKEFIKRGGKILEADIIYKVKNKKIFILIEHQTKNDKFMAFKILNYEVEIMRTCRGSRKEEKEAVVLAAVIHTGGDKWKAKKRIRQMQDDIYKRGEEMLGGMQTIGNYELEDINEYKKEELLEKEGLLYKAMYLEKVKGTKEFIESIKKVYEKIGKEEYEIMNEVVRIALSGNMVTEEIEDLVKELNKKGGANMLALKERIDAEFRGYRERGLRVGRKIGRQEGERIGRQEGERIGRQEGIREEKLEIAKNLLNMGYSKEEIIKATGITKEEIEKIKK